MYQRAQNGAEPVAEHGGDVGGKFRVSDFRKKGLLFPEYDKSYTNRTKNYENADR
jgi:hypothetical protein